MIKFHCPHCSQKLGVPDEYANRRVRCSKCNEPSRVPQPQLVQPVGLDVVGDTPPPHPQQSAEPSRQSASHGSQPSSRFTGPGIEVSNTEALSAARAARNKQRRNSQKQASRSARPARESSGMLTGMAIGVGKIPLSIGLSLAFGIGVCILWTIVARLTGFIFVYFAVGVAAAAAYGLVMLTEHRNAGLGILAILIGFVCILIGKGMIAKWAIMPSDEFAQFQSDVADEFDQATDSVPFSQMTSDQQATLLSNPMITYNMGVMELWQQGQIDEPAGRSLIFNSILMEMAEDPAIPAPEGYEIQHQAVMDHIGPWTEVEKSAALESYYVPYLKQSKDWLLDSNLAKGLGFVVAFLGAFSLWDLIILPISAITAFKVANNA